MHREVERLQRRLAARGVGVAHQDVGAEAHQALDGIGPALEDRAVEVVAGDPALLLGPEGAARAAHRLRELRGRQHVAAADVVGGNGLEQHVAARRIEAAAQRVEERDGARGLARVGVLADAGPAIRRDRVRLAQQLRGCAKLLRRHPGNFFYALRREGAAALAVEVEGRAAGDGRAVRARDLVAAVERGRAAVVAGLGGVVEHRRAGVRIPGDAVRRITVRAQAIGAERRAVVLAQEQRAVGPGPHEGRVVVPGLQQQVGETECQRAVGAGPDAEPDVGLDREARAARVDDDELRPPRLRLGDAARIGEPGGARVVAPEHDAPGVLEIRHRRVDAEGEPVDVVPVEVADLRAVGRVGAAVGVAQALDPGIGVLNAGAGRRGDGEGHALRPVLGGEALESLGSLVEGLVPAYPLPRAGFVLRARAAERMEQAVLVVDQLRRGAALAAERLAGGVRGVGLDGDEAAVFDHGDAAADGGAERAEARNPLDVRLGRHHALSFAPHPG